MATNYEYAKAFLVEIRRREEAELKITNEASNAMIKTKNKLQELRK